MNIVIITQRDNFFIPLNIKKLTECENIKIKKVVIVDSSGSLENKKLFFIKGFGLFQSTKYLLKTLQHKVCDIFDIISQYRLFKGIKSIKSLCKKYNIEYKEISNPNHSQFLEELNTLNLDFILSYSCPVIFKNELLKIPKQKCINLHCSYLPFYSGLMPSFWVLFNEEEFCGSTIHLMDTKIDNGLIVDQIKLKTPDSKSIFDIVKLTKIEGGKLVYKFLLNFTKNENFELKENAVDHEKYYTWPTIEEMKLFRKNGGKLI